MRNFIFSTVAAAALTCGGALHHADAAQYVVYQQPTANYYYPPSYSYYQPGPVYYPSTTYNYSYPSGAYYNSYPSSGYYYSQPSYYWVGTPNYYGSYYGPGISINGVWRGGGWYRR
jgi:hypothetical protein